MFCFVLFCLLFVVVVVVVFWGSHCDILKKVCLWGGGCAHMCLLPMPFSYCPSRSVTGWNNMASILPAGVGSEDT